ncbi:HupE/UreJ family protein [Noviluteimonas gilva]|uniref:HupE/UreJ family protein n=1 Tax=Noviluteimonas gilva TaxID=2682097 RepID=A0A7C9M5I6_9GAMM|nr:HupE/UreJ family protein [Lysobacter gilvus]MUV15766.1 HupE/UreJ family protein [Lysobacter gilvus]
MTRAAWLMRTACVLLLCAMAGLVHADVFRPAYLELREAGQDRFEVLWKVPAQSADMRLAMHVRFPDGTVTEGATREAFTGDAIIERSTIHRAGGLIGQPIAFEGRAIGATDIMVRVQWADGTSQVERLPMTRPAFVVEAPASVSRIAWSYGVLGVEHILGGIDHLLFVLALLLIVRGGKRIVATITAFTVAHSITLVAATMGWVHIPGPPVEAVIALSIVFVASEVVHGLRGKPGLTARAPWVVAFTFGLLHGFGFAGALADVGLPQKAIPVALLMFNVGVEVGQLLFVGGVLAVMALARRLPVQPPKWSEYAAAYAIGSVAMLWVFERVAAFQG